MIKTVNKLKRDKYFIKVKYIQVQYVLNNFLYIHSLLYNKGIPFKTERTKEDTTNNKKAIDKKAIYVVTELYIKPEELLIQQLKGIKGNNTEKYINVIVEDIANTFNATIAQKSILWAELKAEKGITYNICTSPLDGRSGERGFRCTIVKTLCLQNFF